MQKTHRYLPVPHTSTEPWPQKEQVWKSKCGFECQKDREHNQVVDVYVSPWWGELDLQKKRVKCIDPYEDGMDKPKRENNKAWS